MPASDQKYRLLALIRLGEPRPVKGMKGLRRKGLVVRMVNNLSAAFAFVRANDYARVLYRCYDVETRRWVPLPVNLPE